MLWSSKKNRPQFAIVFTGDGGPIPRFWAWILKHLCPLMMRVDDPYLIKWDPDPFEFILEQMFSPVPPPLHRRSVMTIIINPNEKDEEK